jgi:hypothetical protein
MSPEELRSFVAKAERYIALLARTNVVAAWNGQSLPVVFRSKRCDIDIVLRYTDHHFEQEPAVFGLVVSSRAGAEFHGGVELYLFREHLDEAWKWVGELMKCKRYAQIHHLIGEYIYVGTKMAFNSSTILIKRKPNDHPFPAVFRAS